MGKPSCQIWPGLELLNLVTVIRNLISINNTFRRATFAEAHFSRKLLLLNCLREKRSI
jgi:hypothetical protein